MMIMAVRRCGGCSSEILNSTQGCQTAQVSFEGAVLGIYERNFTEDSDFYATVWDAENGTVRDVEWGTTRSWTYHNTAWEDATPQVRRAALAWYRKQWTDAMIEQAHRDAAVPEVGKVVRSLMTRGQNVGVTGIVKWIGDNRYRRSKFAPKRVGIKVAGEDKLRYVDIDRLAVVDPDPVDEDAIRERGATLPEPSWGGVLRSLAHTAPAYA